MYSPVNKCVIFQSANAVYFPRRSDTPDAVKRNGAFLKISVSAITTTGDTAVIHQRWLLLVLRKMESSFHMHEIL